MKNRRNEVENLRSPRKESEDCMYGMDNDKLIKA